MIKMEKEDENSDETEQHSTALSWQL